MYIYKSSEDNSCKRYSISVLDRVSRIPIHKESDEYNCLIDRNLCFRLNTPSILKMKMKLSKINRSFNYSVEYLVI